jgi:branched-chain amino acid transport system substrate-binding protein
VDTYRCAHNRQHPYLFSFRPDGLDPTLTSFVSLEGFVDAMVVTEGLKRAGKDLTREKFVSGIESIHEEDVGLGPKFLLDYGPRRHKGFNSVYATIVRNGRAVTISDWKSLPTQ